MIKILIFSLLLYLFANLYALWEIYKLRSSGYYHYGYGDALKPKKWLSVLIGNVLDAIIPKHVLEQYVLRFYDPICRPRCLLGNNNKCVECGCKTSAKMFSPFEKCAEDYWAPIIFDKAEYEKIRTEYPVQIIIKYGKETKSENE